MRRLLGVMLLSLILTACGGQPTQQAFQATLPGAVSTAPVYTATATVTPTSTPSPTPTPSDTPTLTPTLKPTNTPTPTVTLTPSETPTLTLSPTLTPSPLPTQALLTLTPAPRTAGAAAVEIGAVARPLDAGWSCNVNPCPDDVDGFLRFISVPSGFRVSHVGRVDGNPQQMTYGPDGNIYVTVHREDGGVVVALDPANGMVTDYATGLISPVGLAFQPGTDVLYVSARETADSGGVIYRVPSGGGDPVPAVTGLPCCWREIDNQVNGMVFGPDGRLYVGVSALTDRLEAPSEPDDYGETVTFEASVLRVQPHTGAVEVHATGIRHPFDLTFDAAGTFYATDSGVLTGPGDRLLLLTPDGHYRWPYWRDLGCVACPPTRRDITYTGALLALPDYSLPRGLVAYTGSQYPANLFGQLFVAQWHDNGRGPQIVRVDPAAIPTDPEQLATYTPPTFVHGLLRPVDVVQTPDGALAVADWATGHIWRVDYTG